MIANAISLNQLLTHSCMTTAKTCLRRYYFAYELGLRPDRNSQPLRMGGAFHQGLETLDASGIDAACDAVRRNYADIPAWCKTEDEIEEWLVECETVLRLLTGHVWRWGEQRFDVVATEQSFALPLINPATGESSRNWRIAGKIDRIVRLPDGRLAVQEYKTTSDSIEAGSDYWRRLRLDQQISMYMHAARRLGHDVQTVIYDVTRKPGIRPKLIGKGDAKRRETPTEYGDRLTEDIGARPDFYYGRQEIPRLDSDLAEFETELWDIGKSLRESQKHGRWYRSTHACLHPYRCSYFDLCSNGHDPSAGVPQGFVAIEDRHPELTTERSE